MRMPFKKLTKSDRGATALLVASTMFLLMGVAAVVIDGGFGWSERRQAQAAVDFGSLAALQAAKSCGTSCSISAAVNNGAAEARTVVEANLPGRTLDWAACDDDPNRPAEFTRVASAPLQCVSFTNNLDKARVALPDDDLDTTFGRVIGFNTITVVAVAEAGAYIEASSDVIPHTPTGSAGGEACLFANQASQSIPPCNGAISGFYGYLDVALYGSDSKGTPSTCDNGTTGERVSINMAKGGDHHLVTYDFGPPDPVVDDFNACPNTDEDINQVRVQTGSPTAGLTDGLIHGVSGSINGQSFTAEDGRLECVPSHPCQGVRVHNIDHTPLWQFIASSWTSGQCDKDDVDTRDEMLSCLNWYKSSNQTDPLFTAALADHGRYAAIPLLYSNGANPNDPAPSGPGAYKIKEFIPVWIETLFFRCDANWCRTVHSPGLGTAPPACPTPIDPAIRNCGWSNTQGQHDVESMLAFTLTVDMLDDSVAATFPGTEEVREYALTK